MNTQMAPPFLDPPFSSCGLCSTSFEGKLTEIDMYTGREGVKERGEGCINIVCVCVFVSLCVFRYHMISSKQPGVISGWQLEPSGDIIYSETLPSDTIISELVVNLCMNMKCGLQYLVCV